MQRYDFDELLAPKLPFDGRACDKLLASLMQDDRIARNRVELEQLMKEEMESTAEIPIEVYFGHWAKAQLEGVLPRETVAGLLAIKDDCNTVRP